MEDSSQALPKFICDSCSRKLKAAHAFIQQTLEVNERLMVLLIRKNAEEESNSQLDCLEEAQVDIQTCLEIKMEQDETIAENETKCLEELKLESTEELTEKEGLEKEDLSEMLEAENSGKIVEM